MKVPFLRLSILNHEYISSLFLIPINAKIKFLTQDLYKKCLEKGKIGSNSTTFCSVIFDHTLVDPLLKISDKIIFERPTFLFDVVNKELRENWSSKVELLCAESKLKRSKMKGDKFQSYEVYSWRVVSFFKLPTCLRRFFVIFLYLEYMYFF